MAEIAVPLKHHPRPISTLPPSLPRRESTGGEAPATSHARLRWRDSIAARLRMRGSRAGGVRAAHSVGAGQRTVGVLMGARCVMSVVVVRHGCQLLRSLLRRPSRANACPAEAGKSLAAR